jgi:VWFA-related protein
MGHGNPCGARGAICALSCATALLVAIIVPASNGVIAQQPTFRGGTQVVSLFVTVADAQKRLVPDLQKEDFDVFDNEKLQPLVFFANEVQPITVVVMLDTSGSMTGSISLLRAAAEQFIIRLLPADKGASPRSTTRFSYGLRFTNNRRAVRESDLTTATARGCGTPSERASTN